MNKNGLESEPLDPLEPSSESALEDVAAGEVESAAEERSLEIGVGGGR